MRAVIHIIPSMAAHTGGTAMVVRDLLDSVSADGSFRYYLLCPRALGTADILYPENPNVSIIEFDQLTPWSLLGPSFLKSLLSILKNGDSSYVFHVHGIWKPYIVLLFLLRKVSSKIIKIIIQPHGMLEPGAMAIKPFKKKLGLLLFQNFILRHADLLLATGEPERLNILDLYPNLTVDIVKNGIPLDVVSFSSKCDGSDYFSRSKTIVYMSRLNYKKGLDLLINALSNVDMNGWKCLVVGPDDGFLHQAKQLVTFYGLEEDVIFVGPLYGDDRLKVLSTSKIFVLPSRSENFGVVVLEALALSTPVITTTATPWDEIAKQKSGLVLEPTVIDLTKGIKNILSMSDEDLLRMSTNCKSVSNRYLWPNIMYSLEVIYSQI